MAKTYTEEDLNEHISFALGYAGMAGKIEQAEVNNKISFVKEEVKKLQLKHKI